MPPQFSVKPNARVPFELCYEDRHLIVLNKTSSVVTQPGTKHTQDSLLNGAFYRWGKQLQNLGKKRDFGLLHRLDRGTSGLVIIALDAQSYDGVRSLFEAREIKKSYWALTAGQPQSLSGVCDLPIAESRIKGKKRAITVARPMRSDRHSKTQVSTERRRKSYPHPRRGTFKESTAKGHRGREHLIPSNDQQRLRAQRAETEYTVLETHESLYGPITFIECRPRTGRLHQIRVHMRTLGLAVIGDFDYGGNSKFNQSLKSIGRDRLTLHAGRLEFVHPITNEIVIIESPLPSWWSVLTKQLNVDQEWSI